MFSAALFPANAGQALPLLLDVAAKSLAVSASALAALVCLRRASAATRHLVLLAGLGVLLGLPALMALLPRQEFPRPVPAPRLVPAAAPVSALPMPIAPQVSDATAAPVDAAPIAAPPLLPAPPAVTPAPAPAPPIRPSWLVSGWLLGALFCAGRMLAAQARMWRMTRRCPPLPPSLLTGAGPKAARFAAPLTGPSGTPPMVWGWPRAALLMPPEAADWPAARLRAVVLHESAHVRRCDWLTQTLAQGTCALYWFNPLVWLLAARLGAEAERACDDAVLLTGVPPTEYAQDLLAVARHLGAGRAQRQASLGAVTMARRSPVRGRLEAILDTRRARRRVTRRAAALALAAALTVAAPLASLRPAARADEAPAGQSAPQAGVPTEADIAQARQHLQDLEKARADHTAAHPSTVSPMQTNEQEIAKTALRSQIIQFDKSMTALDRQGQALRTPAVVAFEAKRHQKEEQTYTDMDQVQSADAKSVLYPAQAAHWKQVSADASARLRRRQADIQAMRPPTPEAAAEVVRYDSFQKAAEARMRRWMQLRVTWMEKYAPRRALGKRLSGRALGNSRLNVPPGKSPRMAETIPPMLHFVRPQIAQIGVLPMTLPKSIKPALLKTPALAALAASLALPTAPMPEPEAPKPAAQASVAQVPATGVSHWASFLLRHVPLWKVRAFTGWDRGETLPEGVTSVYFLESNRSVLVRATPAGITHIQGIIRRLDSLLRPVQIRVAFATVTAADLDASGLHPGEVPPGGLGAAGRSPQLFMEGGEGSAVAAYLAALEKRKAVVVAPILTRTSMCRPPSAWRTLASCWVRAAPKSSRPALTRKASSPCK